MLEKRGVRHYTGSSRGQAVHGIYGTPWPGITIEQEAANARAAAAAKIAHENALKAKPIVDAIIANAVRGGSVANDNAALAASGAAKLFAPPPGPAHFLISSKK